MIAQGAPPGSAACEGRHDLIDCRAARQRRKVVRQAGQHASTARGYHDRGINAILRAGLELFIERGIEGASIEQIAKRAGVGKLTIYRRWPAKEDLIAAAIETLVANEVEWPSDEEIDQVSPYQLTEAALSKSAETAAAPEFRALVARILGSAVSHPSLMATYGKHYVLPRRAAGRARSLLRVGPLFVAWERLANTRSKSLVPRVRC